MKATGRELVILLPEGKHQNTITEKQTLWLHELLNNVETLENYVKAVEFVNLHRGGITHNPLRIELALQRKVLGSFQFLLHKN
ncbi:MAG: hypothetical protein EPN37_00815 [Chitinophagaceae bacterium]|jgi:hypothetical protein|nr:MAG: hypothetical protein EPN37_00815 [Chitinophagaceae bacterium]